MQQGSITSMRLPPQLREQLDEAAHRLNRPKNWIISEALKKYLHRDDEAAFAAQMREESLRAAKEDAEFWEQELWERNIDTTGWV